MGREPAQARCLQERVCRRVNHAPAEQKEEPMGIKEFRYDGSQALELNKTPTSLQGLDRDKIQEKTLRNMEAIGQWQDKLYADGREGIVI